MECMPAYMREKPGGNVSKGRRHTEDGGLRKVDDGRAVERAEDAAVGARSACETAKRTLQLRHLSSVLASFSLTDPTG